MTMKHLSQLFTVLGAMAVFVSEPVYYQAQISAAEAIRCYNCIGCFDVSNALTVDGCRACWKMDDEIGGYKSVVRSCSFVTLNNGCAEYNYNGSTGNRCVCNKDLCNGSPVTRMSPKMLFILTCITVIIYRLI